MSIPFYFDTFCQISRRHHYAIALLYEYECKITYFL